MTTPSPESLALLERAAELRASGTPWADAATQLAVGVEDLRRLASEHARDYDRLARRARTATLRETLDAALTTLRTQLASPDPRLGQLAATTIVRYELARMRHGIREAGARLDRDARRRWRAEEAGELRNEIVPKTPEVSKQQEVKAPEKIAHSRVPGVPASAPHVPPQPAPTPPTPPATSHTGGGSAPAADALRRKRLLVDAFARGRTPTLTRGAAQTLEVERLVRGWLTEP